MCNDIKMVRIGCERIMVDERAGVRRFMCQFFLYDTPRRSTEAVTFVSGDIFFEQYMVHEFKFLNPNCY